VSMTPIVAGCREFHQESLMRAKLMLTLATVVFATASNAGPVERDAAIAGVVSSEAEGKMEGVVVTARRAKSIDRLRTKGPRSLIRTVTDWPFFRLVTRTLVPNGSVRCAAVNAFEPTRSPVAARPE
jgi:hypothetical protein